MRSNLTIRRSAGCDARGVATARARLASSTRISVVAGALRATLALGILLGLFAVPVASAGPLEVVTTTEDLAAITRAVGGDAVRVISLSRGFQDPHYVPAKPSLSRKLHDADLLVYVGLELEIGWLPLLIDGARNPRVRAGQPGNLAASAGIRILEVPEGAVDRSQGDVHPEGNPHYWLDPRNGARIAATIAARLVALRPEARDLFESRLAAFQAELEARVRDWEARLAPFRDATIVAYHSQWVYLLDWVGLRNLDYIERRPGIPPSPRHIQQLVARMQEHGARVVLHADFINPRVPGEVAERGGARAVALPTSVGSRPEVRTYLDLFESIVGGLEEAMQGE
jgi:zinc/manganese transport system substrate-binding protein